MSDVTLPIDKELLLKLASIMKDNNKLLQTVFSNIFTILDSLEKRISKLEKGLI